MRQRGAGTRVRLQVRVDHPDAAPGHGITVDECAAVSRELERWLDGEQALGTRYVLEVSSPGIERPVRWREHWLRYRGRDVRVRVAGRGRFTATIVRVEDEADVIVLQPMDGSDPLEVPMEDVQEATLVVDWSAVERSAERTSH